MKDFATRAATLLIIAAFGAGCKAHMIETHGENLQLSRAGLQRPDKGGALKYLVTGPKSFREARRADAQKTMRRYCGGEYKIKAEGPRSQVGTAVPIGDKSSLDVGQFWYVAFDCERR